ncbi:MAG TPA: hypothetical protein VFP65_17325, partial [Anaeromyxobacteraceae bacterium]|nr:hypothetical protein [Anaeromyxobacteraceae bacterium]
VAAQLPLVEGTPLLGVARGVAREGGALARPVAREVRARLLPKTPALAGLAAGWWIASTFTDSELSATLHRFGLGSGPRHAVSSETLHRMEFWVPVLAAALCSYLGDRVATLVRRRYGAPVVAEEQATSGAAPVRRA